MLTRRQFLASSAASGAMLTAGAAGAEDPTSPHYELKEIVLGGDKRVGTRFTLLTP